MTQVVGKVTNIRKESDISNAGNKYTITHLQVDGFTDEINVGFNKEKYVVGSDFNSNVMRNTYGDIVPGTGDIAEAAVKAVPATKKGINAAPYPVPADHPQNIIINQNSMAHATALVNGMLGGGLNATTEPETAIDSRLDLVLRIAPKIAAYSSGRLTQEAFDALQTTTATDAGLDPTMFGAVADH